MKKILLTTATLLAALLSVSNANAKTMECKILADFYQRALAATEVEFDRNAFSRELDTVANSGDLCAEIIGDFKIDGLFDVNARYPIEFTFLKEALVPEARFEVKVYEENRVIKSVEIDVEQIGALRKRPTR